jgi:hypothetical protein
LIAFTLFEVDEIRAKGLRRLVLGLGELVDLFAGFAGFCVMLNLRDLPIAVELRRRAGCWVSGDVNVVACSVVMTAPTRPLGSMRRTEPAERLGVGIVCQRAGCAAPRGDAPARFSPAASLFCRCSLKR